MSYNKHNNENVHAFFTISMIRNVRKHRFDIFQNFVIIYFVGLGLGLGLGLGSGLGFLFGNFGRGMLYAFLGKQLNLLFPTVFGF